MVDNEKKELKYKITSKQLVSIVDRVKRSWLSAVPTYAKADAVLAISKVLSLQEDEHYRPGLYYICLVDLVGSTRAGRKIGDPENAKRIEFLIGSMTKALRETRLLNYATLVKSIGDAGLLLFSHFVDIVRWREILQRKIALYNSHAPTKDHVIRVKYCVHLGEITFENVDPISIAVNDVFKIEKRCIPEVITFTDIVRDAIEPTLSIKEHKISFVGFVTLPGRKRKTKLFKLEGK